MTRDQVKALLPVLQAYADGREIEVATETGVWYSPTYQNNLTFVDAAHFYRVKPDPMPEPSKPSTWYLVIELNGAARIFRSLGVARKAVGNMESALPIIQVQEVMQERAP